MLKNKMLYLHHNTIITNTICSLAQPPSIPNNYNNESKKKEKEHICSLTPPPSIPTTNSMQKTTTAAKRGRERERDPP